MIKNYNIDFQIIDSEYGKVENFKDYLNNEKLKKSIQDIRAIDFNNITYKDAYEKLEKLSNILRNIK